MKIRYAATLLSISLLSLGAIAGCANPCAAKTQASANTSTAVSANPCAGKANPCAGKANPCAGKANPCAAKTQASANTSTAVSANSDTSKANPCAGKANPCAGKANPCAGKATGSPTGKAASVGAPLAQNLHGKPVVVDIYAEWCPACKNIAPTLSQLKEEYAGKVNFVVLDVTNASTTAEAEAIAAQLGLSSFLAANKSQTGQVTIIDPATGNILAQHRNNAMIEDYQTVLNSALNR